MSQDVEILKREEAINIVKNNLKRYANLKIYPEKFEDKVASFSSYLISIVDNVNGINYKNNKILQALIREEDDKLFLEKYDSILSILDHKRNEYLIRIYLNGEPISLIKEENRNIYKYMKDTYEMIACLDENIDYSIDDFTTLKLFEFKRRHKRWEMKKLALEYLKSASNGFMRQEVISALNKIPERERILLEKYVNDENLYKFSSNEYKYILRGLLMFTYHFDKIDFTIEDLKENLEQTGSGWKKLFNTI